MAQTITFPYNGENYTLGFTLRTVQTMEQAGFVIDEIDTKPTIRIPELFYGAFLAHHKGIKRKLVDEIYEKLSRKGEMIVALRDIYEDARNSLIDEGNVDWTMNE